MADPQYRHALVAAGMIAPHSGARGIPVWRERGLIAARLLIDQLRVRLTGLGTPAVVEHPFLMPAAAYQKVFGHYTNTYRAHVSHAGDEFGDAVVLRPDNMAASVAMLVERGAGGPMIAVGGLLRVTRGAAPPLFRDRYMWPAVQLTHLVPRADSVHMLNTFQAVLEGLITAMGLPVITVRTSALPEYGRLCYLTVSVLPNGRPTILSTSYLMADRYRAALGVSEDVLDIGFTGKVIALSAMHHWDRHGIQLPSAVAATQVGVLADGIDDGGRLRRWLALVRDCGLRVDQTDPGTAAYRRIRAEQAFHRRGTPLVVGIAGIRAALSTRLPINRVPLHNLPDPADLTAELTAYDRRLLQRAAARFDRGLRQTGLLRGICRPCARSHSEPIFGWTVPDTLRPCSHCGETGFEALVSESGRFY